MKNVMFFESLSKEESDELTSQIAKKFADYAGEIGSNVVKDVIANDIPALLSSSIHYPDGRNALDVYCLRQSLALYTKRDDLNVGIDTTAVALAKFLDSEVSCKSTNERFLEPNWRLRKENCFSSAVIQVAERKIASILGPLPGICDLNLSFGPGASTTCRTNTTARWKLSTKPACSADMLGIVEDVLDEAPHWTALHADSETENGHRITVEVVPGRLMFVPKNAKTKRSIIVEPILNSFLQKGYGRYIKQRLLGVGVNLFDQSLNQARAMAGSITNSLATVDLSSASDTISTELVRELLPPDWFYALNRARTSRIEMPGREVVKLEKFSSMGNAFTFELESMIFYALTYATCTVLGVKPDVSVYGDDIICPSGIYTRLEEVFKFCGFSINTEKSYSDGPFRESCGADYYLGQNIRPFYQKTSWSPATLCAFHNFLVRGFLHEAYPDIVELILDRIPEQYKIYGPDGYGDGHLLGDHNRTPLKRNRGWAGYVFDTYVKLARRVKRPIPGDRVLPVYSIYMGSENVSDHFAVSGSRGEKRISIYTLGR